MQPSNCQRVGRAAGSSQEQRAGWALLCSNSATTFVCSSDVSIGHAHREGPALFPSMKRSEFDPRWWRAQEDCRSASTQPFPHLPTHHRLTKSVATERGVGKPSSRDAGWLLVTQLTSTVLPSVMPSADITADSSDAAMPESHVVPFRHAPVALTRYRAET